MAFYRHEREISLRDTTNLHVLSAVFNYLTPKKVSHVHKHAACNQAAAAPHLLIWLIFLYQIYAGVY